jgi:predicted TIM-barrel fold metal-dependent hydrolase
LIGLARYANVAVKLTGLPGHSAEAYPFRDIHEPIRRVLDAFGPERCFWGTDLTRLTCSYRQAVTLFTEELPWLTGEPLRLVMGEALCRWVDWIPAPG